MIECNVTVQRGLYEWVFSARWCRCLKHDACNNKLHTHWKNRRTHFECICTAQWTDFRSYKKNQPFPLTHDPQRNIMIYIDHSIASTFVKDNIVITILIMDSKNIGRISIRTAIYGYLHILFGNPY